MGAFSWTFSTLSGVLLLATFGWGILWFWIRRKNERHWLPILQIFPIRRTRFFHMKFQRPPLVPFLCFLGIWILVGLSSLAPSWVHTNTVPLSQGKAIVYVDLTPSVSGETSLVDYRDKLRSLREVLKGYTKLVWVSSWELESREFTSTEAFTAWLSSLEFQRTGRKIATVLAENAAEIREANAIYVVSDRNAASWRELNWEFYAESLEVRFIPVKGESRSNWYFDSVTPSDSATSRSIEWDVVIKSTDRSDSLIHKLQVLQDETVLYEQKWESDATTLQAKLHVAIPVNLLDRNKTAPLRWRILVEDGILLDNEFRTPVKNTYKRALLVVRNEGEHFLATSRSQLRAWLEVLGFEVDLVERLSQKNTESEYGLAMILLPPDGDLRDQCPKMGSMKGTKVWILPYRAQQELDGLCWCYDRFLSGASEKKPIFCQNLAQASELNRALFSMGAKQVGGSVDHEAKSLAYVGKSNGQELLVFTRPFSQNPTASLLSGRLPFLIQSLLEWQQVLSPLTGKLAGIEWLRLEDAPGRDHLDSNVPIGESIKEEVMQASLPPEFDFSRPLNSMRLVEKDQNAMPWVWAVSFLWIAFFLAEVLWFFLRRRRNSAVQSASILILLSLSAFQPRPLMGAPVQLSILQAEKWMPSFSKMATIIASRTSIEFSPLPVFFPSLQSSIYAEPWIWVRQLPSIQDKSGVMSAELEEWVRSGGVLIIENATDFMQLQKLTQNFEPNGRFPVEWNSVPIDHELMRSFYLLRTLPTCEGKKMMAFSFDKRLSILALPFSLLDAVQDQGSMPVCIEGAGDRDALTQVMINIFMVALTTDYKKDQLHMKEVLKRLQ